MKARIIGSLLVIALLGTLYVLDSQSSRDSPREVHTPASNDSALKSLSIN